MPTSLSLPTSAQAELRTIYCVYRRVGVPILTENRTGGGVVLRHRKLASDGEGGRNMHILCGWVGNAVEGIERCINIQYLV